MVAHAGTGGHRRRADRAPFSPPPRSSTASTWYLGGVRPYLLFSVFLSALVACSSLREADQDGGSQVPGEDAGSVTPPTGTSDADTPETSARDSSTPPSPNGTYDDTQAKLAAFRKPGPVSTQGSAVTCSDNTLGIRDSDGTLHTWSATTSTLTNYTFKAPRMSTFTPSDTLVPVDSPTFDELSVYRTGQAALPKLAGLPYAFNFIGAADGVIRLDQRIDNVTLGGTKVRKWTESTGATTDISDVLPTQQPPSSYGLGKVVIPGSTTIPYALYVVDVAAKTVTSVTFDGAIGMRQSAPSTAGLLVSYARSGPTSALRLYRNNQNGDRVEIGDELANLPQLFSEVNNLEHKLQSRIAPYEKWVFYDSAYGVWAYEVDRGTLVPVQLGANKKAMLVDTLCVMPGAKLLAYREIGDPIGQIWIVPIGKVLPL